MLTSHPVTLFSRDCRNVVGLMKTAFPPKELVPIPLLRLLSLRRGAHFLSFRDGVKFVGTAYLVEYEDNFSVFYLAVKEDVRGYGYGSAILEWIMERGKGKNINLDVEALDEGAENLSERLKRVEFYRRNGIVDTLWRLYDLGIKYMVLSTDPASFNPESFTRMWRHYLFGLFSEKLFREEKDTAWKKGDV